MLDIICVSEYRTGVEEVDGMSFVAQQEVRQAFEDRIGNLVTASNLQPLLGVLEDVLSRYNIEKVIQSDTGDDYLVEAFIDAKRVEGKSDATLERYQYIIRRMLKKVGVSSRQITTFHIRKYLSDEKARGIADSTLKGLREVFSGYFGWLHRDGLIAKNPIGNIGPIKCVKKVQEVFSDTDFELLKCGCTSLRNKAIVCMLKSTGCRISEITGLNRSDIDLAAKECIVLGKGNKQRLVYFDGVTCMLLQKYLETRTDNHEALFIGCRGERFLPGGVRCMLKTLGIKSGVDHVHPHKFRRTEITELVNKGMPIEQVRILAGHSKIDTTVGYVVTNNQTVKNSYNKFA